DVEAHGVEPRQREEPLVERVEVGAEAVDRDHRGPGPVVVAKVARVRDAVLRVAKVALALARVLRHERALEPEVVARALLRAEAREGGAPRLYPHAPGRRIEETRRVAALRHRPVEVAVRERLAQLLRRVAERNRGGADQE